MDGKGKIMEIKPSGSRPSTKPPADYFTGAVRQDPLMECGDHRPRAARKRSSLRQDHPGHTFCQRRPPQFQP
ncbi:hypothetical protein ACC713_37885, partial [Rhizobium johnstonii]